ncbi:iron dicitrate transport regulator FecR, partial [Burkholderia pseudomallei]
SLFWCVRAPPPPHRPAIRRRERTAGTGARAGGVRGLRAGRAGTPDATLPLARTAHAALDPIAAILTFYVMAAGLAPARGRDPDAPRHLHKITETH